jgi:hypothetical protein
VSVNAEKSKPIKMVFGQSAMINKGSRKKLKKVNREVPRL